MRTVKIIAVCLLVLGLKSTANAQDISISMKLDTGVIFIGDQINLHYEVDLPAGLNVGLLMPDDSLQKDIEILRENKPVTTDTGNNSRRISGSFVITSFVEGLNRIIAPKIVISNGTRDTTIVPDNLELWVIRTEKTPSDTTQVIFDIVAPLKEPVTFSELLPYLAALLTLGVIIFLVVRYIIPSLKAKGVRIETTSSEPAHIIAFRRLTDLKNLELWQKGEIKEYYSIISEVLRDYLDNRYGLNTMEQTTGEILKEIGRGGLVVPEQKGKLSDILSVSDMVKFAKGTPSEEMHNNVYQNAWEFVSSTREKEEEVSVEQK